MTKKQKIIEKFKNNPGSLKFSEIQTILMNLGFEKIEAKGSHTKFKNKNININNDIIIPVHNNDCKDFYKKQTYKILKNNGLI
ncbi:MAG: type II toxin-antitoxin system HicA family toxin [Candidatus Gracilibacteria bacterium]|nr:type II toxin-antitoxin system HicA family toxin [Candidatus Gracilibacteria bacterium]